jgi:hypothetical protein
MVNWRSIEKEGCPLDCNKTYLVTDGVSISTTDIDVTRNYNTGETVFRKWKGDPSTYEDNQCCSGTVMFDLFPTHWCPTDEINLP